MNKSKSYFLFLFLFLFLFPPRSSWSNPQNCSWPIDQSIRRNCALTGEGHFKCPSGRWCGSNYDALGNFRFLKLNPVNTMHI